MDEYMMGVHGAFLDLKMWLDGFLVILELCITNEGNWSWIRSIKKLTTTSADEHYNID